MTRRKANYDYWNRRRVDNGLERFIRDFGGEDGSNLPTGLNAYSAMIREACAGKYESERLYPPIDAVLRHYESFVAAWWNFGFLVEVKGDHKKYELTPEIEKKLREIYSYRFGAKERPKDLPGPKEYARQIGLPGHVLTKWAQELGLAFTKEPPWSEAEMALLEEHGFKTPRVIANIFRNHGFSRTVTAIQLMRKRRLVHKASPYFSMNAVARLFNVDAHGVKKWIKKGWLKFTMKGTDRDKNTQQNGDTYLIHKDWIYEFVVNHPDAFDIKKVDQLWFLHIITKGDVKLSFSSEPGKRTEGQTIEAPVEFRKSKLKKKKETEPTKKPVQNPPYLRSREELAASKPHGTVMKYIGGCRCDKCRKAQTDYSKARSQAIKRGEYNGIVSAEYARAHIEKLGEAGIGYLRVAKTAQVNHNIVWMIKTGERKQIRVKTEAKILAVTIEILADGATVDATETWERINWLLENGFSKSALARQLGSKTPALQLSKKRIKKSTALKIEKLYNEILEREEVETSDNLPPAGVSQVNFNNSSMQTAG